MHVQSSVACVAPGRCILVQFHQVRTQTVVALSLDNWATLRLITPGVSIFALVYYDRAQLDPWQGEWVSCGSSGRTALSAIGLDT